MRHVLPRGLEGASLAAPLESLHRIYERIEADQARWIASTPYRCPSGCGRCCDHFEPEILEIEALYLAAAIARAGNDRLARMIAGFGGASSAAKGCVLANPVGEYHCTEYEGRPLVCRLFAFSGDRAKDGTPRFRLCSEMKTDGPRLMDEKALLERFGRLPPIMGDLAGEADSLLPSDDAVRTPLREALPRAAAKIRYLADLAALSAEALPIVLP